MTVGTRENGKRAKKAACNNYAHICVPMIPEGSAWKQVGHSIMAKTVAAGYAPLLLDSAVLVCQYGGLIRIVEVPETGAEDSVWPSELQKYYANAENLISQISGIDPDNKFNWDINNINKIYNNNKDLYAKISQATGVPPELIAALHYRESGCDFDTYLHNGQKLGTPTTIVPVGRIFDDFYEAAVDALISEQKGKGIKLTSDMTDITMMMAFTEVYNGTGYTDYRNIASPYVYSGTNVYTSGKYVSDGTYSATAVDKQPGVYILAMSLRNK
jgi:lysozyme family protein